MIFNAALPSTLLGLAVLHCVTRILASATPSSSTLRGIDYGSRILRPKFQEPCILTIREDAVVTGDKKKAGGKAGKDVWACELKGDDAALADGSFVEVNGLPEDFFFNNSIEPGVTTLAVDGAVIEGSNMTIPEGAVPILGKAEKKKSKKNQNGKNELQQKRRLAVEGSGVRTVLVVRVIGSDKATTSSASQLAQSVFFDGSNLKSQYAACSKGQLNFVPATGSKITNGVVEVTIDSQVSGQSSSTIEGLAEKATNTFLGTNDVSNLFDHVMLCLPPGTSGSWIAYAYVNSWLSVFNDKWCEYPSAQLHELAHNLGQGHSNEGGTAYADQTCLMGYSYANTNGPLMCFNAAKSWKFGWYPAQTKTIDLAVGQTSKTMFVGVDDYNKDNLSRTVILKIEAGTRDYYVEYNKATGCNAGTQESANQVVITRNDNSDDVYCTSSKLAALSVGDTYTISSYKSGKSLTIRFTSAASGEAVVDTYYPAVCTPPGCTNEVSSTKAPTSEPTVAPTRIPTSAPTVAPTRIPTRMPTSSPTQAPTLSPTRAPTPSPTRAPTQAPSQVPSAIPTTSAAPTGRPSQVPSADPTTSQSPTHAPTNSPTKFPTNAPTVAPTKTPTNSPTKAPTNAPTTAPTNTPTNSPTSSPTRAPTTSPTRAPGTPTRAPTRKPTKPPKRA